MYCKSEPRANWAKIGRDSQLKNIIASKTTLRAVTIYNDHKNTGQAQEGETCDVVFDELSTMVDSMDVDKKILDAGFG